MSDTVKVWFDANSGLTDQQIKEFLKTKNDDGDFAYFREMKAKSANVLVLQEGSTPPIVFNPKTQSSVYKLWVEHVILETAPIDISRRYQTAYVLQAGPSRSMQPPPLSAAMLIESESETLSSSESEMDVKVKPKKKKISRSATVVGVKKDSVSSPATNAHVKEDSSGSNGKGRGEKSSGSRSKASQNSMDIDTPAKPNREKKPKEPRTVESMGSKKRARYLDDDDDEFGSLLPKSKTPKRAARSSVKDVMATEIDGDEHVTIPKKRARSQSTPDASTNCPRVYLSQANASDREYHKRNLSHMMSFATDLSLATHVVSFSENLDTDSPIPFSILYAIGTSRWVVDRQWLIEAEATGVIPSPELFEIRALPGSRLIRRAQAARKAYLEAHGILERNTDEEADPNLPKLIFSPWTFYLEPLRKYHDLATFKQIQEIITKNGGLLGGEENSDIWITKSAKEPVLAVHFGDPTPPSAAEISLRQRSPHLNKRYFFEPSMLRQMPTYAIPFDFVRISIASGKCEDPSQYHNLIQYSRAL